MGTMRAVSALLELILGDKLTAILEITQSTQKKIGPLQPFLPPLHPSDQSLNARALVQYGVRIVEGVPLEYL